MILFNLQRRAAELLRPNREACDRGVATCEIVGVFIILMREKSNGQKQRALQSFSFSLSTLSTSIQSLAVDNHRSVASPRSFICPFFSCTQHLLVL